MNVDGVKRRRCRIRELILRLRNTMSMNITGINLCWLVVATCALSGCEFTQAYAVATSDQKTALRTTAKVDSQLMANSTMTNKDLVKLEAVSAVSFNGDRISAGVISHGCTSSADFFAEHEVVNGMCHVTIHRSKPDLCRRAAFVANIEIEWAQPEACSDLDLMIANPVLVTPTGGQLIKRFSK